ncbi:MBL fold metallo-hydrolase [Neobittarella massiliensis]|uniref:MBL fold metallo-hydrolase n=1 Tax=Neobittarella massiliensis (ex Bilen et al. 2018) TaxID=2041842 RepID=UPI000CF6826E|nr:MBL fold metallo-hydrolase [Neobittarella massiliensis]
MSIQVTLHILMDNQPAPGREEEGLVCENGFSCLVTVTENGRQHKLLFDTGDSGRFLQNAAQLGLDLSAVEYVALSHAHYDHTRGFLAFAGMGYDYKLLVHRYFFTPKYWDQEHSYLYVGNAFGQEYITRHHIACAMISHQTHPVWEEGHTYLISAFDRTCPFEPLDSCQLQSRGGEYCLDDFREEMALVIEGADGLVVLSGCSHSGPVNICQTAARRFGKPVKAFVGGTHLIAADEERAAKTIEYFNRSGIETVGVCHCTGELGLAAFADHCPHSQHIGVGTVLRFEI